MWWVLCTIHKANCSWSPIDYRGRWRKSIEKIGAYTYIWKEHDIKIIDMYHPSYTRKGYASKERYVAEFKRRVSDVM